MTNLYTMTISRADKHLSEGGAFEAADGLLKVIQVEGFYVLLNGTPDGEAGYVLERLTAMLDIMAQLADLKEWKASE